MRLISNGVELAYKSILISESYTKYYAELIVVSSVPILGQLQFVLGTTIVPVVVYEVKMNEGDFIYTMVHKKVHDLLNTSISAYRGTKTTEDLLSMYGIEIDSRYKTLPVNWNIYQCKLKTFLDIVKGRTEVIDGSGCVVTMTLLGKLSVSFLKNNKTKDLKKIIGAPAQEKISYDWKIGVTGVVNLSTHCGDGVVSKRIVFEEGFGDSAVNRFLTIEENKDVQITLLRNQFYQALYTSRVLALNNCVIEEIVLGDMVEEVSYGLPFFVFSMNISRAGDQVILNVTLTARE